MIRGDYIGQKMAKSSLHKKKSVGPQMKQMKLSLFTFSIPISKLLTE